MPNDDEVQGSYRRRPDRPPELVPDLAEVRYRAGIDAAYRPLERAVEGQERLRQLHRSLTPRGQLAPKQVAIPSPPRAPSLRSERLKGWAMLVTAALGGMAAIVTAVAGLAGAFKTDTTPVVNQLNVLAVQVSLLEGEVRALRRDLGQVESRQLDHERDRVRNEEARSHFKQGHPERAERALELPE